MANIGIQDVPIREYESDSLKTGNYANALAEFIRRCDTPMTISLQGDWGSGKTSLMQLIERHLGDSVIPIWFNTWLYSRFSFGGQLSIMLMRHFMKQLEEGMPQDSKTQWMEMATDVGGFFKKVGALAVTTTANVTLGAKINHKDLESLFSSDDVLEKVGKVKTDLEVLVEKRLNEELQREKVVVFIDDLDRLDPAKAVELLEEIKLFLDVKGCVFVLACDSEVVKRGLADKLRIADADDSGRSFFDKIFQLSVNMPTGKYEIRGFLKDLLDRAKLTYPHTSDTEALGDYLELLKRSVGYNPRNVKRLINTLIYLSLLRPDIFAVVGEGEQLAARRHKILFGIGCMESAYNKVYQLLLSKMNSELAMVSLLQSDLRDEDRIKEMNLFPEGPDEDRMARRLAEFMDVFFAIVDYGGEKGELDRDEISLLRSVIDVISVASKTDSEVRDLDTRKDAMETFCDRVKRLLGDNAPDGGNTSLKDHTQPHPWMGLWYRDHHVKRAWLQNSLRYELRFDVAHYDKLTVALRLDPKRVRSIDERLQESVEKLRKLPLLEGNGYEFREYDRVWVEVSKVVGTVTVTDAKSVKDEEVKQAAHELNRLIEATHDLFDVIKSTTPSQSTVEGT